MSKHQFKVGDRVLIIKDDTFSSLHYSIGKVGEIEKIYDNITNPKSYNQEKYSFEIRINKKLSMGFYKDEVVPLTKLARLFYS